MTNERFNEYQLETLRKCFTIVTDTVNASYREKIQSNTAESPFESAPAFWGMLTDSVNEFDCLCEKILANSRANLRRMVAARHGRNRASDIMEYRRDHQVLITKSGLIGRLIIKPPRPAENPLCMFKPAVAEFKLVRADSAFALRLHGFQRLFDKAEHVRVVRNGLPRFRRGTVLRDLSERADCLRLLARK